MPAARRVDAASPAADPSARDVARAAGASDPVAPDARAAVRRRAAVSGSAAGEGRAPSGREGDLRTAVLDATRQLLVHEGYRDLSMRDVARAVGCSVSSIYLYFAGKDELVHTLMDEGFERWHRRMHDLVATHDAPRARLEAVCRAYVEFGLANPEFYEIMYMFHSDRMSRYPKELFRRARRNLELMAELVAAHAPEAAPTPDDARVQATALWATLHGIVSTIIADRLDRRIDRERYVEGAIRYALAGLRGTTPA
jgi:AcrR family transcriptional regulator